MSEIVRLLTELEDAILDHYNDKKISLEEMKNILGWCEKQKTKLLMLQR